MRRRFWGELGLGTLTASLGGMTLIWKDWIELVFHVDPDAGSGAFEWSVVSASAVATAAFATLARKEWHAHRA